MRHDKYSDPVNTILLVLIAVSFVGLAAFCIYDCVKMSAATQANLEAWAADCASVGHPLK